MRIRPRFDHWIPKRLGVSGIVLYPYVLFSSTRDAVSDELLAHEMIHVRQVRALGWLRFYLRYALEYFRNRLSLKSHDEAYRSISFESEAFENQKKVALTSSERSEIG